MGVECLVRTLDVTEIQHKLNKKSFLENYQFSSLGRNVRSQGALRAFRTWKLKVRVLLSSLFWDLLHPERHWPLWECIFIAHRQEGRKIILLTPAEKILKDASYCSDLDYVFICEGCQRNEVEWLVQFWIMWSEVGEHIVPKFEEWRGGCFLG